MKPFSWAAAFLLLPALCLAQGADRSREVFFLVGLGRLHDDEGSLGRGEDIGGGFAWYPHRRAGLQIEMSRMTHRRRPPENLGGFFSEGTGYLLTGHFAFHFLPGRRVQPFLLAGGGLLHYEGTQGFETFRDPFTGEILDPGFSRSGSERAAVLSLGGGARFSLTDPFFVKLEFRSLSAETSFIEAPFLWLRGSVHLGYRW